MRSIRRAWQRVVRIIKMPDYVMGLTSLDAMNQPHSAPDTEKLGEYQAEGIRET